MTSNSFATINSYTIEEITMIAGDTKTLYYNILDANGGARSVAGCSASLLIYPYGDTSQLISSASCSISGSPSVINQFSVSFSGSGLAGMYQQHIKVWDSDGTIRRPARGKIFIIAGSND